LDPFLLRHKITKIIVTGANGGVGSKLVEALLNAGFEVHELSRRHRNLRANWTFFDLRKQDSLTFPADCAAIIHCAHDFTVKNWKDMRNVNVAGTLDLYRTAIENRCPLFIFLSSMAAFDGARSNYGRGKREIEAGLLEKGAICVRPGLIYGVQQGLVEKIRARAVRGGIIPLIDGGMSSIYPVSVGEVCEGIIKILHEPQKYIGRPVLLASSQPNSLRNFIDFIAPAGVARKIYFPIPWWLAWLPMRMAEFFRLPLPFRSDSLIGLRFQNETPLKDVLREEGLSINDPFKN